MSERLEDFIRDNREQFDDVEPSTAIWSRIELNLPRQTVVTQSKRTFTIGFVLRVAAAIFLITGIGFIGYIKFLRSNINLAAINPQYAQQQAQYVSLVETKRNELKAITRTDPQLYRELNRELGRMDSVYRHLKSELPASPNREKVLRAMIQNLQIQTQILNQQLIMVEQYNKMKSEQQHETRNI